jgi:dipeptidyl aminopeptidase/acylaminoacyl peptidase
MQSPFTTSRGRAPARVRVSLFAVALLALVGLGQAAEPGPGPDNFFQNERMTGAELSPDGLTVALTTASSRQGRVRLVALDLKTMKLTPVVAFDDSDVASFHWVNDHRLVFSLSDRQASLGKLEEDGDAGGLYGVDADGGHLRLLIRQNWGSWLVRGDDRQALPPNTVFLSTIGDRTSDEVYVYRYEEFDVKHIDFRRLQRLDTMRGRAVDIDTPPRTSGWVFDNQGRLRVITTVEDNRTKVLARSVDSDTWNELGAFETYFPGNAFTPRYIDEHGTLYVDSSRNGNTQAVWTYDLEHRQFGADAFLQTERYDIAPQFLSVDGKLAGLRYVVDAQVTQWLDPKLDALQAIVDKKLPTTVNELHVASRGNGRFVVIHAFSDRVPGLWFLYQLADGKLVTLGNEQPDIDPKQMATLEQVHYPARDGLDIPAWLTVPHGAARKDLPLVVLVHGGPFGRGREWGWNPQLQFLAARGYAVLEPEFRGSTGYGSKLFVAGWKQWGLGMQNDVADGVKWAVAQGIVDPKRVCIAGASYGGYAALMGLVNDPDIYRCGIDWVGVTDIDLLFNSRWSDLSDAWKRYGLPKLVGDPKTSAAQFKATSPIEQVARIRAPVLLAYGGKDLRVPLEHGERFHAALMRQPGARSQWIVYENEGHGWRTVETRIDFWNRAAKFLDDTSACIDAARDPEYARR